jgi:hypothetical protein
VLAIERLRMQHKDIGFEIDSDGRAILEYGDATRVEMEGNRSVGADAVYTLPLRSRAEPCRTTTISARLAELRVRFRDLLPTVI